MTNYQVKTESVAREYQNGQFITVSVTLDNGGEKLIDAFEGKIDYIAMEKKAGYPIGSKSADNYTVIDWLKKYRVTWVPKDSHGTELADFDNLEDAVRFYIENESDWKVIYQFRKLVDGSEDTNVVTYRWN